MFVLASVMALAGCGSAHRSAAEYVSPARYHAVTVTATILRYPRSQNVTQRFTSAVVITELADTLNGAPAMQPGPGPVGWQIHCPAEGAGSVRYALTFETAPGALLSLQAFDHMCGGVAVAVWGKYQPPLSTSFAATAAKLLGLRPPVTG
jgi:hypothetical protein